MKKILLLILIFVFIQTDKSDAAELFSFWINLKVPSGVSIITDSSLFGVSADVNLAIKRNLIKLSYSYFNEDIPFSLDFISPSLKLKSYEISYGYIFNTDKIIYNINFGIGLANYIIRGKLILDSSSTAYMSWDFSRKYDKIESTKMIFNFPAYVHYRFTDYFSLGIFFSPFYVRPISGIEYGLVMSIGKLWSYK